MTDLDTNKNNVCVIRADCTKFGRISLNIQVSRRESFKNHVLISHCNLAFGQTDPISLRPGHSPKVGLCHELHECVQAEYEKQWYQVEKQQQWLFMGLYIILH